MNSFGITTEQCQFLAAKFCRMQRELGCRLMEHLYQNEVPHDDELQSLASRAFDDMQQLQQHVRALTTFPTTNDAA